MLLKPSVAPKRHPCEGPARQWSGSHWLQSLQSSHAMGSVGKFGWITQMTKKCLCLATGVTTVHLVNSSFLGFKGFMA